MINSRQKAPPSPGRPVIHVEVPQAQPPDVVVNPQIHVAPSDVIFPKQDAQVIPEHPKLWDIQVVERDELGLIKRVVARAITQPNA